MVAPHFNGQHGGEVNGPFSFMNPTTRRYRLPSHKLRHQTSQENLRNKGDGNGEVDKSHAPATKQSSEIRAGDVERLFRTRDNRKGSSNSNISTRIPIRSLMRENCTNILYPGRHQISISPTLHQDANYITPAPTNTFLSTLRGVLRMFTTFPYWDISYLVALIFTIGSIDWVVNAFFVWLPLQLPSSEFPGEIANAGGISAFVGATIFEVGSVLLMIEAVNENRAECFGWAVEEVLGERGLRRLRPEAGCVHHHGNKRNLVGKGTTAEGLLSFWCWPMSSKWLLTLYFVGKPASNAESASKDEPNSNSARTWTWRPTWHELKTHYFKELGFLACLSQMIGATIFVSENCSRFATRGIEKERMVYAKRLDMSRIHSPKDSFSLK